MGTGSRCLTIPAVSSSFTWTTKQVARLGTSTGTIYILAKADLELDDEEEVLHVPMTNTQYDHYQQLMKSLMMMRGRTIKVSMMKGNVYVCANGIYACCTYSVVPSPLPIF